MAPSADRARPGDAVILSGPIGLHGVAIMSVREGLEFEVEIASDTRRSTASSAAILAVEPDVHVLRDPTRGGLASALNEIAAASRVGMVLEEAAIPIPGPVRAACEILGLDPLHVANEGKLVAIVPAGVARTRSWPRCARRPEGAEAAGHRRGRRRSPGDGHDPDDRRLRADRRHAGRGAAAPDLLSGLAHAGPQHGEDRQRTCRRGPTRRTEPGMFRRAERSGGAA